MKRYLLLYSGPPTPPRASHRGWPQWFDSIGDALVDRGSPMTDGTVLRGDGSTSGEAASLNGFSVIQAEDRERALDLVRGHPFLLLGSDYVIEMFEVPRA
jgi:YCII-related domain